MIEAEQLWKFTAVHDYVIGDFMWTGIDYQGEAGWPSKSSSAGLRETILHVVSSNMVFYK